MLIRFAECIRETSVTSEHLVDPSVAHQSGVIGASPGHSASSSIGSSSGMMFLQSLRSEFSTESILIGTLAVAIQTSGAQPDTVTERGASRTLWWATGIAVAGAFAADASLERASLANRSATLDDAERFGNALGAGKTLIPALGAGYLGGKLFRRPRLADAALHTAVAYALGNVLVSAGKPVVGRHRPDTTGSPWRFHPFTGKGSSHSWPSAHTLHAFTIAGAVAEEANSRWVTGAVYGAAALVGWSRMYADEHWASDVASSAVLGAVIGHGTVRVWRARSQSRGSARERNGPALSLVPDGRTVVIHVQWEGTR